MTCRGAFARADLLLCRSGASTVAEVTAAGKPAIFIPLPTAADDHQRHNAETLANGGAARLLVQSELSAERLVSEVTTLLGDRAKLTAMSDAAHDFPIPTRLVRLQVLLFAAGRSGEPERKSISGIR